jgi:uncharacterized protein
VAAAPRSLAVAALILLSFVAAPVIAWQGGTVAVPSEAAPAGAAASYRLASNSPAQVWPAAGDRPEGMARDERIAASAVDRFWKRHFAEHFGGSYHSPLVVGGYLGRRGPSCNGRRPIPLNAFYCKSADFLAWDQDLMGAGYRKIGRAWVYLIIAHEWGHAIQARVSRRLLSVAAELQADCLAGVELAGVHRDGVLVGEPEDADQIGRTLTALADDSPWTRRQDHGDAAQRIGAYRRGWLGGVPACL